MTTLLPAYLMVLLARLALRGLNLRHLRRCGHLVPPGFEAALDAERLGRARAYTLATSRVGLVQSLMGTAAVVAFLFGGGLAAFDRWVHQGVPGPIAGGVVFLLGLQLGQSLLGLPFEWVRTFGVEARFGFNRTTPRLWLADRLKAALLGAVLLAALSGAVLAVYSAAPRWWWLWGWGLFAGFTVLLLYLTPHLIEPMFFRFEPVRAPQLERRIRDLAARAGLAVSRVLQCDASRRSGHSNAYFSGIGRVKRIVLFDTLVEQMGPEPVLGVLAHEMGHWKRHHGSWRIAATLGVGLAGFWAAHRLLPGAQLPALVGAAALTPAAKLVVLSVLGSVAAFPLTPLAAALSRRAERAADRFAVELTGAPGALAEALVILGTANLANLHPHPLYAWFHFSHPPLVERVTALGGPGPSEPAEVEPHPPAAAPAGNVSRHRVPRHSSDSKAISQP